MKFFLFQWLSTFALVFTGQRGQNANSQIKTRYPKRGLQLPRSEIVLKKLFLNFYKIIFIKLKKFWDYDGKIVQICNQINHCICILDGGQLNYEHHLLNLQESDKELKGQKSITIHYHV